MGVGRWEGVGGVGVVFGGKWGAEGEVKYPFELKWQCCAFSK